MSKPSEAVRETLLSIVDKNMAKLAELREQEPSTVWSDDTASILDLHGLTDEQLREKQMRDPMNWINAILEHMDKS